MIVICSYCRENKGEKEPLDDQSITHTICDSCLEHLMPKFEDLKLGEFLNRFDAPIALIDDENRIMACNSELVTMLDRVESEVLGFLGGEVFECGKARLPEGCGKTIYCEACTLRRSIKATLETKEPQLNMPTFIDTENGRRHFKVSTELKDDMVLIRFHDE